MWRTSCERPLLDRITPLASVLNLHCEAVDALARWERKIRAAPPDTGMVVEELIARTRARINEYWDPIPLGVPVVRVRTEDGYEPPFEEMRARLPAHLRNGE